MAFTSTQRNVFTSMQNLVHGNDTSLVIPCALLLTGMGVVLHNKINEEWGGKFLLLVLGQMTPLAIADMKILRCKSPLRQFCVFSEKVFLMNVAFLALRVLTKWCYGSSSGFKNWFFLAVALPILIIAYEMRPTKRWLVKHLDVIALLCSIVSMAVLIEVMEGDGKRLWKAFTGKNKYFLKSFLTSDLSNLIELSAFLPAIWTMYRAGTRDPHDTSDEVEPKGVRIQAVCFFAWLLSFYYYEDLKNAMSSWDRKVSTMQVAHFLLLLDFAAFVLGHFYNPQKFEKLKGSITSWLVDASAV